MNSLYKKPLITPMRPRSPDEMHRASTPLELLFDLVFVVAVALAGARLHHGIIENHIGHALLSYVMVFFAIWWAWMNFSWFASAYDTDDVPYRLMVLLHLMGALILAAGVPQAFDQNDFTMITLGYIFMRLMLIAQWARAWYGDSMRRPMIIRYIIGLFISQLLWVGLLFIPQSFKLLGFIFLVLLELIVPLWAEMVNKDLASPWHPEHIVERYGLFTIIVLGESILSATLGMQASIDSGNFDGALLQIAIGGVLIVFSMWWSYFQQAEHQITDSLSDSFFWGYGHYFIFASAAAVGAGLAVAVDAAHGQGRISQLVANAAVVLPVVLFSTSVGFVHGRIQQGGPIVWAFVLFTALMIASIWTHYAVILTGLWTVAFLGFRLWVNRSIETVNVS